MNVDQLTRNELVDDRAVRKAADDRFRHGDFVRELAGLAATIPTPANVALYAPWGSGKSGLAQLLAVHFKNSKAVEFVHFDAFKHGEAPLRRQFLIEVADQLGVSSADEINRALYDSTTTNELNVDKKKAKGLLLLFLGVLGALTALVAAGAVIYASLARWTGAATSWWNLFVDAMAWATPKAFVPATLLSALASLTGNQFKTERRVEPVRTDEQFEKVFKDIVRDARSRPCDLGSSPDDRHRRIVVFIDELDRCSPAEVASTLETLRTFLEVSGCVFIVAADQQALEEALTHKVRQATPANLSSPYYSVGSAYLDKIFQVQLQLPPLKPQRLTRYALELVEEREGVWRRLQDEGANLAEVVSVLIPSHVDSPRRVKALLNNFALTYRLAERRAEQRAIASGVAQRALEIAKLTCLRLEFPLFAADLALDARLPDLVVDAHVLMSANGLKNAPQGQNEEGTDGGNGQLPDASAEALQNLEKLLAGLGAEVQDRVQKWAALKLAPDRSLVNGDPGGGADDPSPVERELASQLVRYLRKTASVQSPKADLIHLESAADSYEHLDQADGDALEQLAVDADIDGVRELLNRLDPDAARDGVRLLASLVGHATVGLEGSFAVRTLFAALGELDLDLGAETADAAARAVTSHEFELGGPALLGAIRLSRQTGHSMSTVLRRRVISSPDALTTSALQRELLRQSEAFLSEEPRRLAQVVLEAAHTNFALRTLQSLAPETGRAVLRNLALELREGRLVVRAGDDDFEIASVLDDDFKAPEARLLREAFAAALLAQGDPDVDATVLKRRDQLLESEDPDLAVACLERVGRAASSDFEPWLEMVDLERVEHNDGVVEVSSKAVDSLATAAWDAEDPTNQISALERFKAVNLIQHDQDLEDRVVADLTSAAVPTFKVRLARELVALGLLSRRAVADASLRGVKEAIAAGAAASQEHELRAVVAEEITHASNEAIGELQEALVGHEPVSGAWHTVAIELSLAAGLAIPYDDETIAWLTANHLHEFEHGLSLWIVHAKPDAARLLKVLAPVLGADPASTVGVDLREQHDALTANGVAAPLAAGITDGYLKGETHRGWLRAARVDKSPAEVIAVMATRVSQGDLTLSAVEQLLDVWEELRLGNDSTKRTLAAKVLLPLARLDGDPYLGLTGRLQKLKELPSDRRREILTRLRETAKRRAATDQLEEQIEAAGLKRRKGPLGGKTDI